MSDILKPGELQKMYVVLVKCLECNRVDAIVPVNDFISLDARGAGWYRKADDELRMNVYNNWICPDCYASGNYEVYTRVSTGRYPIDQQTWKAPEQFEQVREVSRPEDFNRSFLPDWKDGLIASAARIELPEMKTGVQPGDICTFNYEDIDGAIIQKTYKVDADGVHLIPLED